MLCFVEVGSKFDSEMLCGLKSCMCLLRSHSVGNFVNNMELIIANTENTNFKIEYELNEQIGALPLPFSGMDKSTSAVCTFFNAGENAKNILREFYC